MAEELVVEIQAPEYLMAHATAEPVVLPDSEDDFGLPVIPEESEEPAAQQDEAPVVVMNVPPARNVRLPARLLRIIEYALPIDAPYPQNAREVYAEIDKDMVDSSDPIMKSFKRFLIRKGIYQQHFGEQLVDSDASADEGGDSELEDNEEEEGQDGGEADSEDNEDGGVNGEDEANEVEDDADSDTEPVADAPEGNDPADNDADEPSDADQSSNRKRSGTDAEESNTLQKKMKLQNLDENQQEVEEEEGHEQAEEVSVEIVAAPVEEENAETDDESVTTDSSDSSDSDSDSSSESDSD